MSRTLPELFDRELKSSTESASGEVAVEASPVLAGKQVALLCGFVQEGIFGYFSDARKILRAVSEDGPVTIVRLHSPRPPALNVEPLRRRLLKLFENGGRRPVLLIAHSQGAIVATACLLRHPELLREGVVDRLISVQAPYGGSLVVDAMIRRFPSLGNFRGLQSIQTSVMTSFLKEERERFASRSAPGDAERLHARLFFVRSGKSPGAKVWWLFRQAHRYLNPYGRNDGFLLEDSQRLEGLGTDWGALEADHSDLLYPSWMSGTGGAWKQAFMRALLAKMNSGD